MTFCHHCFQFLFIVGVVLLLKRDNMSNFEEVTYNTSSYQVVCEHPRLIVNPLLPELIAKYHVYFLRGVRYCNKRVHEHYFNFNWSPFSIKRNGYTKNDIPNSFVCDETTGETFPIFMEVPCNHCDVCKQRKISSFVQRCKLETLSYNSKPWFVTLTYDNEHYPEHGTTIDIAQRFLKRLRINLVRAGYPQRIRYVLVHEYGKNTHRSHMHAILWNLECYRDTQYREISDIIKKSWNQGFIQRRLIDPKNDKAFYYTAKYLKKDCYVPEGMNPCFVLSSRGHGGIGSRFLDNIAPELRKTLNIHFKYLNKWSNKVETLVFSQYVLNRIFPSWSKSVPSVLRRSLAEFGLGASYYLEHFSDLFTKQIKNYHDVFKNLFSNYVYYPSLVLGDYNRKMLECIDTSAEGLLASADSILKYKEIDFEKAEKVHRLRNVFLCKLFANVARVDISNRAYLARRNFGLSRAREIL